MSGDYDDDTPSLHQEVPQDKEAPSGALPLPMESTDDAPTEATPKVIAPIDQVTDALAGKDATALLKIANQYGVGHDDPLWSAVLILLGVQKAASETIEAAGKVEAAGGTLGQQIFDQTTRAGDELKTVLMDAATKTGGAFVQKLIVAIAQAISKPVDAGVKKIEEAAGGLDASAQKQRDTILATWRKDLTVAAQAEASRRNSLAAATSWIAVLVTCIVFLVGGAFLTHEYEVYSRSLLPPGYSLLHKTNGQPACGTIPKYGEVCGVRY
ncbi:MAG: hypothetical protein M0Z68_10720 [Gammaproteobacteria bacterium]|nr:hypothetical protein [Gammaproteobacteria bacterium]